MGNMTSKPNQVDLSFVNGLLEAGKVKPVIDKRYPLSEVPEALRFEEGHARRKVVITVEHDNNAMREIPALSPPLRCVSFFR